MLMVEDLSLVIQSRTLWQSVSFELEAGEIALVLGDSGCGKSSLLKILSNQLAATGGRFSWSGSTSDNESFASSKGIYIPQQGGLFKHLDVLSQLTMPLMTLEGLDAQRAHEVALHWLEKCQVPLRLKDSVDKLSGGQRQRLALARALALKPKWLLLDEPTSAQDPKHLRVMLNLLHQLAQEGVGMMICTHQPEVIRQLPSRLLWIKDQQMAGDISSQQYLSDPSGYPELARFLHAANEGPIGG